MTEVARLVSTIKRLLKARGMTYRDVADFLKLSEPSVKRLFGSQRLTVQRLAQISQMLGMTLAELLGEAEAAAPSLQVLTQTQEAQLVADEKLMLVAVCALNHWSMAEMVAAYRLSTAECLKRLLVLDRMGLIALLPGNRIRPRVARDFAWLQDGPIRRVFQRSELGDFVGGPFDATDASIAFVHAMLTAPARAQLLAELNRLRSRLAVLHDESARAPLTEKRGTAVLLAMREWEPSAFRSLRRTGTNQ